MASIDDVRWSASRRLKTIAHLVDAAAMVPETHYAASSAAGGGMLNVSRPSRDGLRRAPTPGTPGSTLERTTTVQRTVEGRPEMQFHDPSSSWGAAQDGDSAVTSLLPLPPQTNTPSQRPGTGELAVKSPRSLWHYVKALEKENAGMNKTYAAPDSRAPTPALSQFVDRGLPAAAPAPEEPLLHGLPPDYAVFCRERMGGSSRRLFFPPWVQRPEVGWEDTVHSFESHRWMWATLSQANRKRVLQLPQHEILSRAVSDGPDTGGPSQFAMPPNCADLLAAYLPSEAFCRAVQELFLQALLHGQALLPVHTLCSYSRGRIIRDEVAAVAERQARAAERAAAPRGGGQGRRNPLADPQRRQRRGRRGQRSGARSVDASELNSSSVSSMSLLLEELESQRSHTSQMGGTVGESGSHSRRSPDPSEEGAMRLMTNSLRKAKSVDPKDAMRQHRYPWRMPFLIRGSSGGASMDSGGEQSVSLGLTVHTASGIRAADRGGTSDPFVTAYFEDHESVTQQKTAVVKKSLAPTWDETLLLRVPNAHGDGTTMPLPMLILRMWDDDRLGKDFLGEVKVPADVWSSGSLKGRKKVYKLEQRVDASKRQQKDEVSGSVVLSFETTYISLEVEGGDRADRPWTPTATQELNASQSLLQDGMGRPARAPVGGREGQRCMCYCIRCDCYRDANEFFLWNIEHGQHCSDQDCPQCFRRGVRWCWLCVEEELEETPHTLPREVHEEKAAANEICALVHWLLFVLDERLHAAVGHPLHAAWGQPHGCNPLMQDQHDRLDEHLEELRLQHASLNHDWLFGCLEAMPQEGFDYNSITKNSRKMGSVGSTLAKSVGNTSLRSAPGTSRSVGANSRGGKSSNNVRALTDKALPRSMASLSSGVVDDAEMQLIMHTIDELTAGGANNAAKLGPERAAHLAKLSRLMVRKIHQHSQDMGEHDTLILTQKYLYLRRLLASHRGMPVDGDDAMDGMDVDVTLDDAGSPIADQTSRTKNSGGALRAREALSPNGQRRGLDESAVGVNTRRYGGGPGSPGSPSQAVSDLNASGLLPGLHPDHESLLDVHNQQAGPGADELLWEDMGQSGTMGWEARRLMKTLQTNQGGAGTSGMGDWAAAGDPALRVKGTDRARHRVRQEPLKSTVLQGRRQRKEQQWEQQPTNVSAVEKADLLRRRNGAAAAAAGPYQAAPWGAKPARDQLGSQIKYGALMSAGTWDKIV